MSITVQDPSAADFFRRHGVMPAISPMRRIATWLALIALCLFAVAAQARDLPQDKRENKKEDRRDDKHEHKRKTPNILFVIMDDVGIDQMRVFGYGGETPPATPTIDTIANEGIRFRNTWSMPACSTSRAVIFTGRFPLRTRVYGALGPSDLANSQVSPYEMTLPKLLKQSGYTSALFGKFHIGLQGHSPLREAMPRALGWDYFHGWLDETGDPSSIDKTAGNVALTTGPPNPFPCGFVPGTAQDPLNGADVGACYAGNGSCQELRLAADGQPPGRICRDRGGIFEPSKACRPRMPDNVLAGFTDSKYLSAHYVSPLVIDDGRGPPINVPQRDIRARTYRGTVPVDAAIDWIGRQPKHKPWMATVSFASAHTPVMQPPQALLSSDPAATSALNCTDGDKNSEMADQRELTNLMIEALDTEFARLLVSTGLAKRGHDGQLKYNPHNNDTMIVIVGDNGTLGGTVKLPFDPKRAKGTAYQTGVWVPLVVAGPLVKKPDRDVPSMVNIADLYQLFGEVAGIEDVQARVPRKIDAQRMLPYLTQPDQASIRTWNFTQVAPNLQAELTLNSPCGIGSSCTQIPVTASVCSDNGGIWYGETLSNGNPLYPYCCNVNLSASTLGIAPYNLQPLSSVAVRNDAYKLVKNRYNGQRDGSKPPSCGVNEVEEFYEINENYPVPRIDIEPLDLLARARPLTDEQRSNLDALRQQLQDILRSEPPCPGDGNIDGIVNEQDLKDWEKFATLPPNPLQPDPGNTSSWYDFNFDGKTNRRDLEIIHRNLGTQCAR
ncbi:MAG: sulfatase-like hydrolase/transferase [Proteobacteria bacterium]|nr:sulfatase-like hydrolase/transferase [Pseudomonadota bacterium]